MRVSTPTGSRRMSGHQGPSGPRADSKRRAITEAALKVFLAEGFDASVDRIATVAGASKVTVYNHFGSKEDLFHAVIYAQLDDALAGARSLVESRLVSSLDLRADLIAICQAWVAGLSSPDMIALRNLVAGESRRFPQLGVTWLERGPERLHALIGNALRELTARNLLSIPDIELAVLQLSGLVVSPHLVYGSYGERIGAELTVRLADSGVDMFLAHYRPQV
jgi:TetR/AcrR family transcriptional regulator, mexJK operon transcriptional repressor